MHFDWLEENASYVVVVGRELLENGLLLETEEINVVVHASESVRLLVTVGRCYETQMGDKETLLGFKFGRVRVELLYKAVHGGSHAAESFGFGQVDGSETDRCR